MTYVDNNFYTNTLIHRVKKDFVVQGGGYDKDTGELKKDTLPPIKNEANNGLSNLPGTVAMARTSDPNSATSQFFINLVDNSFLNYSDTSAGYAVFGAVTKGMDVVQKIANLKTYSELPFSNTSNLVYIEAVYETDVVQPNVAITRIHISGSGRVVSSPAGINCGSICANTRTLGKSIKLIDKPAKGYIFAGWSGDCTGLKTVISVNRQHGNHNCTAVFTPPTL